MMLTPQPRPDVVALLEQVFSDFVTSGERTPEYESRRDWSTAAERAEARGRVAGEVRALVAAYRAAADQQDAELAAAVAVSDEDWLRHTGIVP